MEHTKNPLLQTVLACLPQKKLPYFPSRADADFDFSMPMTEERQMDGGASRIKWTWSSSPLMSEISQLISRAKSLRVSNRKSDLSGVSI